MPKEQKPKIKCIGPGCQKWFVPKSRFNRLCPSCNERATDASPYLKVTHEIQPLSRHTKKIFIPD